METVTLSQIWGWIAAIIGGWILLVNGAEKLVKVWKAAKAPDDNQNQRIGSLEDRMNHVEECLDRDNKRFKTLEEGNRVMVLAQLALLDHGLDGNNIKQMEDAKRDINVYLANK